jgi:bifunctional DNase/RNase
MVEVSILTVVVAHPAAPSVVVLAEKGALDSALNTPEADLTAPQLLPIWIGYSEAQSILLLLSDQAHSRPLTHDLLANVIDVLGSKVENIVITKIEDSTFFATLTLEAGGRTIEVDARPSDSIALALRSGARIFVDEDVMNAAARQFSVKVSDGGELLYSSEDEMERFHSFIESVSPEDFTL